MSFAGRGGERRNVQGCDVTGAHGAAIWQEDRDAGIRLPFVGVRGGAGDKVTSASCVGDDRCWLGTGSELGHSRLGGSNRDRALGQRNWELGLGTRNRTGLQRDLDRGFGRRERLHRDLDRRMGLAFVWHGTGRGSGKVFSDRGQGLVLVNQRTGLGSRDSYQRKGLRGGTWRCSYDRRGWTSCGWTSY